MIANLNRSESDRAIVIPASASRRKKREEGGRRMREGEAEQGGGRRIAFAISLRRAVDNSIRSMQHLRH